MHKEVLQEGQIDVGHRWLTKMPISMTHPSGSRPGGFDFIVRTSLHSLASRAVTSTLRPGKLRCSRDQLTPNSAIHELFESFYKAV